MWILWLFLRQFSCNILHSSDGCVYGFMDVVYLSSLSVLLFTQGSNLERSPQLLLYLNLFLPVQYSSQLKLLLRPSILPLPTFPLRPLLCNLSSHKYPCLWHPFITTALYQPSHCVFCSLIFATSSEECSAWMWLIFTFRALCGILCFEPSCIFQLVLTWYYSRF